jgi:hypothetical protein
MTAHVENGSMALRDMLATLVRVLLAAFFAFVGYWKALGPIDALAEHHAWVAGLPVWFARAVGWSELACAAALVVSILGKLRRLATATAIVLIVNQLVALGVHLARGEAAAAGPQNLVLIALLAYVLLDPPRSQSANAAAQTIGAK